MPARADGGRRGSDTAACRRCAWRASRPARGWRASSARPPGWRLAPRSAGRSGPRARCIRPRRRHGARLVVEPAPAHAPARDASGDAHSRRFGARLVARSMIEPMEGFGGLFGDPEEMRRRVDALQAQMQGAQKVARADNGIKLAVEMTVAAISSLELGGASDEQAVQVRDAIRIVFPEAVTLVREAREGLQD